MVSIEIHAEELDVLLKSLKEFATKEHTCAGFISMTCEPCLANQLHLALRLRYRRARIGQCRPRNEPARVLMRPTFTANDILLCGFDAAAVAHSLVRLRQWGVIERVAPDEYRIANEEDRQKIIDVLASVQEEHNEGLTLLDALERLGYSIKHGQ